jgi:hypothetical protein
MTALVICLCGARAKEISSKKKKDDHGETNECISAGIDCANQQTKEGELKGRRELLLFKAVELFTSWIIELGGLMSG